MYIIQKFENMQYAFISIFALLLKSFLVMIFNGYLICFHLFISKNNLTTYEFIIKKIEKTGEIRPDFDLPNSF